MPAVPTMNNRDHYGYGAGRRICPGMHLAERVQWRAIAKILWAFDIVMPIDPVTGTAVVPEPEAYEEGLVSGSKPFQVEFRLRSPAHEAVILREVEGSLADLRKYE
ncbi:cytochrome p450 monooxygenase [Grosmannia clavigera kw1407]|uniref:Cytochrome p450 monooxygenase n=1 Tax=Grosmannia clavigera (strain kw1407 / UAMH 11150) TaxID=655863 RepID=F0X811_GROCL|nr:cytochrome p450 monooxygenase [Grosmannia clavigera kw1407]EFX05735.1 cytochrome p450 monooxygenase [Grosmannia clavigera kw1407]